MDFNMADLLRETIEIPLGPPKDRIFNPASDPKHTLPIAPPYQIKEANSQLGLTFLTYSPYYNAPKAERKAARNVMRRAGVQAPGLDTRSYPLADTIIVELGSNIENGFVVAVRYFGYHSAHNRWEDDRKILSGLIKCIIRGCEQIQCIIETDCNWIKRVIFQTDSDDIMQAAVKIWDWIKDGFPNNLPSGVEESDYIMMNYAIENLEKANGGTGVLFWKLPSEYLPGVYNQCETQQSIQHNRRVRMPAAACGPCTEERQLQETMFALTGNPCCPDRELVSKYGHLKKGDRFRLTNTAGVAVRLIMQIDGKVAVDALAEHDAKFGKGEHMDEKHAIKKVKEENKCGH